MKRLFRLHWPVIGGLAVFWMAAGVLVAVSLRQNDGHLVYALDDAYIHMAVAKNFVQHGVWGVTQDGFTSSVSSLLWPLLLSFTYLVFGVNQVSSLALNLLFGSLALLVSYWVIRRFKLSPLYAFTTLVAITFFGTLPALVLEGMEHTLQMSVTLLATYLAARLLSGQEATASRRDSVFLLALAPLVTAVRFEGMALILVMGALFVLRPAPDGTGLRAVPSGSSLRPAPDGTGLRRRWGYGGALVICGFLPVIIFGMISLGKGWYWLPNSVLLKGRVPALASLRAVAVSLLRANYSNLAEAPHLVAAILAALFLYVGSFSKRGAWESRQVMTTLFVPAALLQMQFGVVCLFCRYDAYLIALGVLIVAVQGADLLPKGQTRLLIDRNLLPKHVALAVLGLLLVFPLALRGAFTLSLFLRGTTNIFEQQYQMGLFVRQFYPRSTVALNDIGAVNFLADIHCLDLWGLANLEVAGKKRRGEYHTSDIAAMARRTGARIAIVYDGWFGGEIGGLPPAWVRAGRWTIPRNVVASDDTVSIYAVDPSEAPRLIEHLRAFSTQLPSAIIQSGPYTEWVSVPH